MTNIRYGGRRAHATSKHFEIGYFAFSVYHPKGWGSTLTFKTWLLIMFSKILTLRSWISHVGQGVAKHDRTKTSKRIVLFDKEGCYLHWYGPGYLILLRKSSDFRELVQNIFNALKANQQMTLIKTQHCQPESNLDFLSMSSLF